MDDLISRQAAIDVLAAMQGQCTSKAALVQNSKIWQQIKDLPSAQPHRKRGEWIEDGYSHYKAVCSECGEPCATYIMGKPRDKYCKWCGADMRETE